MRNVVLAFALQMDREMDADDAMDHKTVDVVQLVERLKEEVSSLVESVRLLEISKDSAAPPSRLATQTLLRNVQEEAADVGNFAMMVADRLGALRGLCKRCQEQPIAYYGAVFCGAACTALSEANQ